MNQLYKKNGILFAILWIVVYVVGFSIADNVSAAMGVHKLVTVVAGAIMSAVLIAWIRNNQLLEKYGLCKPVIKAKKLLYYLPLVVMTSVNLWFGVVMNLSLLETILYIISMLFVGFLEEIIFRGLLFKEMCKDNVRSAIIVSSVTFGIGHIVNLINGSGADLLSNLLQMGYAIAIGFLFTILFYRTKSLLACIATHCIVNALSVFANEAVITPMQEIISALALAGISIVYAIYIAKLDINETQD